MRITLIRHAETNANAAHIWQGHTDAPLSPAGIVQCKRLGSRLERVRFDAVICSDLGRTRSTAASFAGSPTPDPAWREANVGNWEGFRQAEIAVSHADQMKRLLAGEDMRLGDTGETLAEFRDRVVGAFESVVKAHAGTNDHIAVVTHGGVIASLLVHLTGKQRHMNTRTLVGLARLGRLANTSLTTVEFSADAGPKILAFNDASHTGATSASTKAARLARVHVDDVDAGRTGSNAEALFADTNDSNPTVIACGSDVATLANQLLDCEPPHATFATPVNGTVTHFEWLDGKVSLRDHGVEPSDENAHAAA